MSKITQPLSAWLRDSLRSGMLFGRYDEPLDAYGLRIVRAILVEVEAAEGKASNAEASATSSSRIHTEEQFGGVLSNRGDRE
jgi:hypothetical protein